MRNSEAKEVASQPELSEERVGARGTKSVENERHWEKFQCRAIRHTGENQVEKAEGCGDKRSGKLKFPRPPLPLQFRLDSKFRVCSPFVAAEKQLESERGGNKARDS